MIDFGQTLPGLALAGAAFLCGAVIGWERHAESRTAGLRTFPIVSLSACAFVLIGQQSFPSDPDAQARILQGLMTGIGFIGGGVILKQQSSSDHVVGIATAASIWNTGAIGAAIGHSSFGVALVLTLLNFLVLRLLPAPDEQLTD